MNLKEEELNEKNYKELFFECESGNLENIKILLENGLDINKLDIYPSEPDLIVTPLFIAAFEGHLEIVKLLIQNNADVNKPSNIGTPLHACSFKWTF